LTNDFAEVFEEKKMKGQLFGWFQRVGGTSFRFVGGLGYQEFLVFMFGFGLPAFSSFEAAAALCVARRVDLL
jgi:hypothetical protein